MRMSRERIFHLTDLIVKELESSPAVQVKNADELRPEIMRALTEESKLEESIDRYNKLAATSTQALITGSVSESAVAAMSEASSTYDQIQRLLARSGEAISLRRSAPMSVLSGTSVSGSGFGVGTQRRS